MASINVSFIFIQYLKGLVYIPLFTELNASMPILYGILIYFYTKLTLEPHYQLQGKPLLIGLFYGLYFLSTIWIWQAREALSDLVHAAHYSLKPITTIIFLIAILRLLLKTKQQQQPLKKEQQDFHKWILWITISGFIICGISMGTYFFKYFYPNPLKLNGDYLVCSFLGIYFFLLWVMAFNNSHIFKGIRFVKEQPLKNKLTPECLVEITAKERALYQKIQVFMEQQKPYLDTQLSLPKLAELVKLPVSKVSRLINQNGQVNFIDFVNGYRIREVQQKIQDPLFAHLSLLGIALESGFNSKASFNRTFKKIIKMTPSAYRKEVLAKKN